MDYKTYKNIFNNISKFIFSSFIAFYYLLFTNQLLIDKIILFQYAVLMKMQFRFNKLEYEPSKKPCVRLPIESSSMALY